MRTFLIFPLVVLLLWAGVSAAKLGLSELYAWSARTESESPAAQERSLAAAQLAVRLDGGNTEHLQLLAWRADGTGDENAALQAYRDALLARPGWPQGWAAIARHHANEGEYGEPLTAAIKRAHDLGPGERSVHLEISELGIVYWYNLAPEARSLVESSVHFSLTRLPGRERWQFLKQMQSIGRQRLVCRRFATESEARWCRQYTRTSAAVIGHDAH